MKRAILRQFLAATGSRFSRSALCLAVTACALVCFASPSQATLRKIVLMVNEVGHSHPGPVVVTNAIVSTLQSDPQFEEEFYWENMDAADISDEARDEVRNSLINEYRNRKPDLIVLMGPDPLRLTAEPWKPFYSDVPAVFCCTIPDQVDPKAIDYRATGSWFQLDPGKTLDAALRLLPDTHQVYVVAGQSNYDRGITKLVKAGLAPYETLLDIKYLTNLSMNELQGRLRQLFSHSIVLYLSFFKDAQGRAFLNAPEALPLIAASSVAPVFGISSSYLGRGVVGGFVMSVEEQGKIAARYALEILRGKSPRDLPIAHGPSIYLFDWRELRRWKLDQSKLPAGSLILFREPTIWEQHKLTVLTGLPIFLAVSLLFIYLMLEQKRLSASRNAQEQLSAMLINAQEKERSRLASELHDDFSQRIALLALKLENAEEAISSSPDAAVQQVHDLLNSVSEIGADLHTLSHRLHSSILEKLGLVPGITALCKEFSIQHAIQIDSSAENVPRSVDADVALCVFRIIQEGLRNLKRHSGAANGQVRLRRAGSHLVVSVCDEGVGFDVADLTGKEGLGIRSMEERANSLGGRLDIISARGKGTEIKARVPLHPRLRKATG